MFKSPTIKIALGAGVITIGALAVSMHLNGRKKKRTKIIEMMDEFQKAHVHMADPDRVEELVTQLIKGGKSKLQVITDFDRTLSRTLYNGHEVPTCHGVLDDSSLLPEHYREQANQLRNTYLPLEMSTDVPIEEKRHLMVEWWTKGHELLVNSGIKQSDIQKAVEKAGVYLREGSNDMIELLHRHAVPLLVFSAGIGDILIEAIKLQSHFYEDNMHCVSNCMEFNEEGRLTGFKGELIHSFNKHEVSTHQPEYFERNKHRTNVILMGDTLGDLRMADGLPDTQHLLTIGFLNSNVEKSLEAYKAQYDIVLVLDETMDLANALLNKIL
ncbi:cytosolic 5'-nucleotidase 3-like [Amphiura filiformis]|uniref:cytosolic 5'-nucleotidase 3-like n=1 Tax=Amphiura filiformis TaxID=82378 RepID=UPI003B20C213